MKTLREIFEPVRSLLHHGPSLEPFHQGVIDDSEQLNARVTELEKKMASLMPPAPSGPPTYISAPVEITASTSSSGAGDNADSDLLAAQRDPVSAGPDTEDKDEVESSPDPVSDEHSETL